MTEVVCRDWERHAAVWVVDLQTGGREPIDATSIANGWTSASADHQFALVGINGRLELWIDGTALDLAVVELRWSTGDWSADEAPTCRVVAVDRATGEKRYELEYPDPASPIALVDPTYDGIDHDADDFLSFVARANADQQWPAFYLAHLERGLQPPVS
jgi:hypothetical protein